MNSLTSVGTDLPFLLTFFLFNEVLPFEAKQKYNCSFSHEIKDENRKEVVGAGRRVCRVAERRNGKRMRKEGAAA